MSKIKLYDGCVGITKKGDRVKIHRREKWKTHEFMGDNEYYYTEDGLLYDDENPSPNDIIELVEYEGFNRSILLIALETAISEHEKAGGYEWTVKELRRCRDMVAGSERIYATPKMTKKGK